VFSRRLPWWRAAPAVRLDEDSVPLDERACARSPQYRRLADRAARDVDRLQCLRARLLPGRLSSASRVSVARSVHAAPVSPPAIASTKDARDVR
jgi:hypothetical protein